jgi:hypothetical protein
MISSTIPFPTRRETDAERAQRDADRADATSLLKSDKGEILPCEHNAFVLIDGASQYAELHYDEFLRRPRLSDRDWKDEDYLAVVRWLQSAHRVAKFTLAHARHAVLSVAHSRRRDLLKDFVDGLPEWDGVPRIDQAFAAAWGSPDTPLIRAASGNFFIAAIARALRPGSQVDTLWTFEGKQGSRKSQALRELAGDLHAEISAQIGTTDFQRELQGVWIAELSELDALRGREASTIKRLLSAPKDRFVQKYALHAETYPRRAVAVASTNEATYWQDATGARRLVPIACGEIRIDLIAANRLQWFAEARHQYANGATWWEFPALIESEQDARQQVDAWEDELRRLMVNGQLLATGRVPWPTGWISSSEIMRDWLRLEPHQQGTTSGTRLGRIMRRLGYRPQQSPDGRQRGWIPDAREPPWTEVSDEMSAGIPL